ncbi:MAG: TlpA family protein disulfide reductase [SAR324 cluster bacterium]|nr:TlpA family protein disulfide reductase [SAR324 cluster bacterium]
MSKHLGKHLIQLGILALIVYQVAFTWYPMWISAKQMEGFDASGLPIENEQGKRVYLSAFKGKPLIINVWASWCLPCRMELPFLAQIYPHLNEQGKQLIGVNLQESLSTIQQFRQKVKIPFPVFRDAGPLAQALNVQVVPSIIVVNRHGKIESITFGFRPWIQAYLLWWV